jgi:hypothetical protein
VALVLGLTAGLARAQTLPPLPPGALQQVDQLIGNRVETLSILDTQSGATGGLFRSKTNDTDVQVTNLSGRGMVAGPWALGNSGLRWAPVFEGGIGRALYENTFDSGALLGNRSTIETLAVSIGGGARFIFLDYFSLTPTFGLIYAHSENEFNARTDVGRQVASLLNDTRLNWEADTLTLVPGLEGRYEETFGPVTLLVSSLFKYYDTRPIQRSTTALSFESESQSWENKLDVDVALPLHVFGRPFHVGGYFARADLFGGLEQAFGTDYIYKAHGRVVLDIQNAIPKFGWVKWIGLGGGYFWSNNFSGYSFGIEVRLDFTP